MNGYFRSRCQTQLKALTRNEVLIILLIIAALTLICPSLYNFEEVSIRAKQSRVYKDFRSLATALETYHREHQRFPAGLTALTTPNAYIAVLPYDSFQPKSKLPYDYLSRDQRYIMWGTGPDNQNDLNLIRDDLATTITFQVPLTNSLVNVTYDPTKGIKSVGDIWRSNDKENINLSR